jgi:hypothetical protein
VSISALILATAMVCSNPTMQTSPQIPEDYDTWLLMAKHICPLNDGQNLVMAIYSEFTPTSMRTVSEERINDELLSYSYVQLTLSSEGIPNGNGSISLSTEKPDEWMVVTHTPTDVAEVAARIRPFYLRRVSSMLGRRITFEELMNCAYFNDPRHRSSPKIIPSRPPQNM